MQRITKGSEYYMLKISVLAVCVEQIVFVSEAGPQMALIVLHIARVVPLKAVGA